VVRELEDGSHADLVEPVLAVSIRFPVIGSTCSQGSWLAVGR
jgi:hypothetical protein